VPRKVTGPPRPSILTWILGEIPDGRRKWNVPVGLYGGKTIKIGHMPVNLRLGMEYSVVSPDTFGQRAQFRLQIQPVVPSLVQNPIFGSGK